jgi:predicted nucleotidyltransferase
MDVIPNTEADTVVSTLRAHVPELRRAGIRHLSLFGSTARGEAGVDSDIDLIAELNPDAHIGLIRLAGIELRLGEILGRKVDLLTEPVGKEQLRANIDRDRRRVF